MIKLNQEKGGATLFVLISMLFFSLYLIGIYLATANLEGTQVEQTKVIKEIYEQGTNDIDNVYNKLNKSMMEKYM